MRGAAPVPPAHLRFAGALAGVGFAFFAAAWFWVFWHGEEGPARWFALLHAPLWLVGLLVGVGAVVGWWTASKGLRHPTGRRLLGPILAVVLLSLGIVVGVLLAVVAFVVFWIGTTGGTLGEALLALLAAAGDPASVLYAFVVVGVVVGLVVAAFLVVDPLLGSFARRLVGAFLGAVAGMMIFAVGAVVVAARGLPAWGEVPFLVGEAANAWTWAEVLALSLGASIGFLLGRHAWQTYGVFTLVALVSVVLGYLAYTLTSTLPEVPAESRALSIVLFAAETGSLGMVVLYSFYTLDVAARKRWTRAPRAAPFSRYYVPMVAFQVPTFNEPPELVFDTLRSLLEMDYPKDRYVIMVADDSTDTECAEPLRAFCEKNGVQYVHREKRGGFKAGALNNLREVTPDGVELVAIIDADYLVDSAYLAECVGFFVNEDLAWIQTPQSYRNRHQSYLTERFYRADAFFYRTVLPSRNEQNSIIFCGTMGILRLSALDAVGGWGEKYITEDAELSVRLTQAGYDSLYVNKTYGRGLIPPTFDGYKKQQYRWAFGGAKIFRGYAHRILFGRFTPRQAMDHIAGTIHWFEGMFVLVIGLVILALAAGELGNFRFVIHHDEEVKLVGLVPFFILVDGVTRLHLVMRRGLGLTFGETLGVMGMWFSVKFSNMRAALKALIGFNLPFVRTPKGPDASIGRSEALRRALRVSRFETFLAVVFWVAAWAMVVKWILLFDLGTDRTVTRGLLALWLSYYALVFSSAPLYAYRSYVTFRPDNEVLTERAPPRGAAAQ